MYVNQTEHLFPKFVPVARRQRAVTVQMGVRGLDDHGARGRLDERRCTISLHLRRDMGMDLALDLDLLLLDGGAVGGPPVGDNGSGFFTSADVELG